MEQELQTPTIKPKVVHKFDKALKKKYDKIVKRVTKKKQDAVILFEGDEGEGKTNHAVCLCDYLAQETGRTFYNPNIFFDVKPMIDIAKSTTDGIFQWDEPALQGLKKTWWNKTQIQLTQLLLMARKKRHIFVFCIADFTEFFKYIIRRAIFMIRIYTRGSSEVRRFLFFPRKRLRGMFDAWNSKRKRLYNKFKTIHGSMEDGYLLPQIIDENLYESEKDKAIMSIGEEEKNKEPTDFQKKKIQKLQAGYRAMSKKYNISLNDISELIGINVTTLSEWKKFENLESPKTEICPTPLSTY